MRRSWYYWIPFSPQCTSTGRCLSFRRGYTTYLYGFSVDGEQWSCHLLEALPRHLSLASREHLERVLSLLLLNQGSVPLSIGSWYRHWSTVPPSAEDCARWSQRGTLNLHPRTLRSTDLISQKNILISSTGRAVIGDFGISRVLVTDQITSRTDRGTTHWMAPELLLVENSHPSQETDIWAFGGVCYEVISLFHSTQILGLKRLKIFTGRIPFYQYKTAANLIVAFIRGSVVPVRPTQCDGSQVEIDDWIWDLLKRCWDSESVETPHVWRYSPFFRELEY